VFGLTALLYRLSFHGSSFFIWTLQTPEALGSYSAAQRLFAPLVDTTWMFVTPMIAAMSFSAVNDKALFRRQMTAYFKLLLGAAGIIAASGLLLAPVVMDLLYGDRYSSGELSSVAVFRWLTLGFSCAIITPILVVAELSRRHERNLLWISAGALAINVVANLWAVPRLGAEGGAIATCCSECAAFIALAMLFGARQDIRFDASVLVYVIPGLVLAIVLYSLDRMPYTQLAAAVCLAPSAMLLLWQLPEQRNCRSSSHHATPMNGPDTQAVAATDKTS
jgi:O-antigen/teichoic acid export membrane protein